MRIYMAGGVSGNLKPFFSAVSRSGKFDLESAEDEMKIFLAGYSSRKYVLTGGTDVKVFLAGVAPPRSDGLYDKTVKLQMPYILESFYYADKDTERLMPYYGDFLLDS